MITYRYNIYICLSGYFKIVAFKEYTASSSEYNLMESELWQKLVESKNKTIKDKEDIICAKNLVIKQLLDEISELNLSLKCKCN